MNFRQVHLDFHTSEKIDNIGGEFDKAQFQKALEAGHVNSITVFSKCHHGWAYHPSEANEKHPNLHFDLLGSQIEAAHEIGVKTPVYLSAGLDEKMAKRHSEWIVRNKDQSIPWIKDFTEPGFHLLCFATPYLEYLAAQVEEVCKNYDADGIFLDIVSVHPCYCHACIAEREALGMDPYDEEDVMRHAEMVYKRYAKRIREAVEKYKPGLPIFHNGGHICGRRDLAFLNSHLEIESLPTGGWGYDNFPLAVRYVQNLGMDYLGMTGKFHMSWGEFGGFKHPNALRYEAALSAALGAKCSVGDQLAPSGKMDMTTYKLIGEAYKELEEKESWIDNVKPVCDIAVVTSDIISSEKGEISYYDKESDKGVGRMMLEGKYQYSIVDLEEDLGKYKVIILPDSIEMVDKLEQKLKDFVNGGGKILASGTSGIKNGEFAFDFGAKYEGECEYKPSYIRPKFDNPYESDFIMYETAQKIELCGGEELAQLTEPYFNRTREHFCSHMQTPSSGKCGGAGITMGKDGIYIAWNIFEDYATFGEVIARNVVIYSLNLLLGDEKSLVTDLGAQGIATLMQQGDRFVTHLLYAVPTKRGKSVEIIEDICPVYNVSLSVKLPKKVSRAYLAPQMRELELNETGGRYEVKIDKVDCHQMVVFE